MPIRNDAQLADALPSLRNAPTTAGTLELIVARPSVDERRLRDGHASLRQPAG